MLGTSSRIVLPLTRKAVWELRKSTGFLVPKKRIPRINHECGTSNPARCIILCLSALSCAWVKCGPTKWQMKIWFVGVQELCNLQVPSPTFSSGQLPLTLKTKVPINQTASHMRPSYRQMSVPSSWITSGLLHNGSGCHCMFKWNHEKWWNCVTWSGNLSAR